MLCELVVLIKSCVVLLCVDERPEEILSVTQETTGPLRRDSCGISAVVPQRRIYEKSR